LAAVQASYSLAGAAGFIPGVEEAAVDPAPASAPRSCFCPKVEDDEGVRWAGLQGWGVGSVCWANPGGLWPGKCFSLFFSASFLLFCFLFSVLLFLLQICYFILQVLN
jgi:hypothetical protein